MSKPSTALILGATGQTGGHLLKELLASSNFTRVGEYGRKVTPLEKLPNAGEKLEQKTIDFENLEAAELNKGKWDVVFITLGTTRALAGSAEAFEKIDREYVVNAARAVKSEDATHSQRLVYVSSGGANASSPFLYAKSKGLTENALASLGYSDTIIFRPGMLVGTERATHRIAETVAGAVTGFLSHFTDSVEITVASLAKSVLFAGANGTAGLPATARATQGGPENAKFTIIGNTGAVALSKL